MEFALHNTLVKNLRGNLIHQSLGIPMGDPHSPGMAIGACAWMEKLWMETPHEDTKKYFRAVNLSNKGSRIWDGTTQGRSHDR